MRITLACALVLACVGAPASALSLQIGSSCVTERTPVETALLASADLTVPLAETTAPGSKVEADDEIVVKTRARHVPGDPLQEINAKSFAVVQEVDKAVLGPVALAYKGGIPSPIRSGLRNFLYNLREPVVALNFMLQLKPGKAFETAGRFALNSTVGVAGMMDIAKRKGINLPRRPNGFANTLGYYGVKNGPFFFLPMFGPTTLRDFVGNVLDRVAIPVGVGAPFNQRYYTIPANAVGVIDYRAEFDEQLMKIRASEDPYVAARTFYLKRRQAEIDALHGR